MAATLQELQQRRRDLARRERVKPDTAYARHKQKTAARQRKLSEEGREIGEIGVVADPIRRRDATASFRTFCEVYLRPTFYRPWCNDHLTVIQRIETAVSEGGLFALAMPRGSGKSALSEAASLWAAITGRQRFVFFVGGTLRLALDMLGSIRRELENNDKLGSDWPEVCRPIAALDRIVQRGRGQLYRGQHTDMAWSAQEIVLPTIRPLGWLDREDHREFVNADGFAKCSGDIVRVAGMTAHIRGAKFKRSDREIVRPSLVILDDPQTRLSALNPAQCQQRMDLIQADIMRLAGPGKKISVVCPCTVIREGDLADMLLDREKNPDWHGERMKMLYSFPTNMDLWQEYWDMRQDDKRTGRGAEPSNEFYRQHQAEMGAGAVAAWEDRKESDEVSAIQHAMNRFLKDKWSFFAEDQNEPLKPEEDQDQLQASAVAARTNGIPRGIVPLKCSHLTAFVDVQQKLLYWLVAAWADDFTGAVIDYGTFPDQGRPYFTLDDAQKTLARQFPATGVEGGWFAGLDGVADLLLKREWRREDNVTMKIERLLVDSAYGNSTDTIFAWCRQAEHAAIVLPYRGFGIGPVGRPMSEYTAKPGDKLGFHWYLTSKMQKRATRYVISDVNWWKSFVAQRLTLGIGDKASLTLFGRKGEDHRMFADHCCVEKRLTPTSPSGRKVDVWKAPPHPENHLWDSIVGCAVAASMMGASLKETSEPPKLAAAKATRADYEAKRRALEARRGF